MSAAARSLTCGGCGVTVSRIDGGRVVLPETWVRSGEDTFCLNCRRSRAAEAAEDGLTEETKIEDRAKVRREGLIDFELKRTPDLTDRAIARACRTSAATVAAARRRLKMDDGPAPQAAERPTAGSRR
jgi:hypothetical protein